MRKFSEEEISEIIRTAQIFASHLTEDQYQKLVQMQQEMANSEFIEAAWGVLRLQQKYGIPCSETPGKYVELLKETAKEESRLSQIKEQRKIEEEKLKQTLEAVRQAKAERHREEKEVKHLRRQAVNEKKRLREEVHSAMQEAQVNQEDIAVAVKLKAELESRGLDLRLTLGLFQEFARDEDAAGHLAEAVAEYGSQLEAREVLRKQNEELKVEEDKIEKNLTEQRAECHRHQEILSQLRSDIAEQDNLRRFWRRFAGRTQALEYLAKWRQVVPMRCYAFFCGARFWVDSGPTYFRTKLACPCCRQELTGYDEEAFTSLGLSFRGPFRIELGE
jgi:hypothetical protein